MIWIIAYLYVIATGLFIFQEYDYGNWNHMKTMDKVIVITWPFIPVWLIIAYVVDKYDDYIHNKERKKREAEEQARMKEYDEVDDDEMGENIKDFG